MELPKSELLELPKRAYNQNYTFPKSATKQCVTNYYTIELGPKTPIYQMTFDTEPSIPNDSKDLLFDCIRAIKRKIKEAVELIAISGRMLWGLKELKQPLALNSEFKFETTDLKFEVIIKVTKTLNMADLMNTPDGQVIAFQIYNNEIKQILRQRQMQELQRGKYFDKKEVQVKESGLNILRGFKFTLCKLKSGLHLQIDVCSRVYRRDNLLQELSNKKSQDYAQQLVGSIVLTNYGRRRTYKIVKINYDMNPYSKFWHDKKAGQVTFAEYYNDNYGLKVSSKNQPLVQVILRTEKSIDKKTQQLVKKDILGYLIPEFISLTGMSDEQRANFNTMKSIAPFTKLKPSERVAETNKLLDCLNGNGRLKVGGAKRIVAFQLLQPYVRLFNNYVVKNQGDGNMVIRDKLKYPLQFKDFVIAYSLGKDPKYDDGDADALMSNLNKASEAFGVKFNEPGFITCQSTLQSWMKEIQTDIEKNGKPQIIMLYFQPFEQKFYGALKKFISCDLKIPCQAIRRRTILKAKNPLSSASKIIVQMNQKIGGTAWQIIQQEGAYTAKYKTMYGSFAISKGKKGFTLAFVGSIDPNFTKVFCYCKTGYKNKENIAQADFEAMFVNWAKYYVAANKEGPQLIIIYREGLSEQQTKKQVSTQLEALRRVVKKIGEKTKSPNYDPQILYTTVTTKINSRFFDFPQGYNGGNGSNKFQPPVENPNSGTVVMDELTTNENYDFFMAAQRVTEGTCTPTHYQLVYNTSKISIESFSQFTYEQCFNYYNWTGAVKVPATMQCANKLAKLVGESIQANITEGEVLTSYFFL